jgi:hypothetical protein
VVGGGHLPPPPPPFWLTALSHLITSSSWSFTSIGGPVLPLIGAVANLCVLVGRWIHGQVRLPIPCYDLTELRTATLALPPPSLFFLFRGRGGGGSTRLACVDTCDGQCERAPGTHSARYDEARLRNVPRSRPPSQRPVPTTRRLLPRISPGLSLCAAHCNTRVTQDIECIRTYPRPACLALSRTVGPLPLPPLLIGVGWGGAPRVSPIPRPNSKITPWASGGHAQPWTLSAPSPLSSFFFCGRRGASRSPRPW